MRFTQSLAGFLGFSAVVLIFIASQLFWMRRLGEFAAKRVVNLRRRRVLALAGAGLYLFLFSYNIPFFDHGTEPTRLTLPAVLLEAPFRWWFLGSVLGFFLVVIFWTADRMTRAAGWAYRAVAGVLGTPAADHRSPAAPSSDLPSLSRRCFLEQT